MTSADAPATWPLIAELRKIPAFFRRDMLVTVSYRMALATDWFSLVVEMVMFSYVAKIVDPSALPLVDGVPMGYLEYVTVGIAVSGFLHVGLGRVVATIRNEQLMGTLEVLLLSPVSTSTLQLGIVAYDLVYVPLRTTLFLLGASLVLDVHFEASGILPTLVLLIAFIPFVWGVGITSAASVLAFRRGGAATGIGATALTLTSGAFFPLALLPEWVQTAAQWNPMTITIDGIRSALVGVSGWDDTLHDVAVLLPMAMLSLVLGFATFRRALRHERRRGTLGLY